VCRRCGADVAARGLRACRSVDAYRSGLTPSVRRPTAAVHARDTDDSPFPRPAFAPASGLVQVEWEGGTRRCIIEDVRLPTWVAAGIVPLDARLRHEGASRHERVSEAEACRDALPDPPLAATVPLAGLTDPSRWPGVGNDLLRATSTPPKIDPRSAPTPLPPDPAKLAWMATTRNMDSGLRELALPRDKTPGPGKHLITAASRAWSKEGGGLGSVLGAVSWATLEIALSALRHALLVRWYGQERIEDARRLLAQEHERRQVHRARVATVHAAWRSLQAQRAIATAKLVAASARMAVCRGALAALIASQVDSRDERSCEPTTEAEDIKLRGFRLEEVHLSGIGAKRLATLTSAGIETAADIDAKRLERLPKIQGKHLRALLDWRAACVVQIRAEPDMAEAAAERQRIELSRSIEAAVDLQAALLRCLHCRHVGVKRITKAAHIYENALERARHSRGGESPL